MFRQEGRLIASRVRRWTVASLFLASAGLAYGQAGQPASPMQFDLQGHRGARWLLPENTIVGFSRALSIGVTTLETDIVVTKDKVLYLSHDTSLNPDITRGPDGKFISTKGPAFTSLNSAELEQYDVGRIRSWSEYSRGFSDQKPVDGTRIPKLSDLFDLTKQVKNDQVRFALETKINPLAPNETDSPEEMVTLLLKAVREAGMEGRTSILSFDWRTLKLVQQQAPNVPTVYLTMQQPRLIDNVWAGKTEGSPWTAGLRYADFGSVPRMIKAAGGHTWSAFWRDLNASNVREARDLGLQVLAWTVNDASVMRQMMDMGVTGIVTDRPDLLRSEMQKRGLPLPTASPGAGG